MISAETLTNLPSSVPRIRVDFKYDYMSRRISKTVGRQTGGGLWQLISETSFLYDGWNLISEVGQRPPDAPFTNFYVYGLDLSGSLQGAGGIGGLLAAQLGTNSVVYTYDGNGNVSELINTLDGTIAAHYEYSPFGEVLVATGELAGDNPFQFSTKYFDSETGLNYYGYRYYSPSLGRWVNRDPIGEEAFLQQFIAGKSRERKEALA